MYVTASAILIYADIYFIINPSNKYNQTDSQRRIKMQYLSQIQQDALFCSMRKCGEIMKGAHKSRNIEDCITAKEGSANFVTEFDVLVQNTLIEDILKVVPDAKFLAEEKDNNVSEVNKGHCFVIDPIDGTTNFIHDYKSSSISVGLLFDGTPVFGAVYDPYKDELFSAHIGEGAYCNGEKISVSKNDMKHSLLLFGASPYYKDELADISFSIAKDLFIRSADLRRGGSAAIDMCALACGRADIFFEQRLSPWDFMASYVIITEAGGSMTLFDGSPVSFDRPQSIVCTNSVAKADVLTVTTKYI